MLLPDLLVGVSVLVLGTALAANFGASQRGTLVTVWSMAIVLFVAGLLLHHPGSPYMIPSDGLYYSEWGQTMAAQGLSSNFNNQQIWPGRGVLPLLIALLEVLIGGHVVTLIALSTVVTCGTFRTIQLTALIGFGRTLGGWIPAVLFISSPPVILFGNGVSREPFFWFGVALLALSIAHATCQLSWKAAGIFGLASLLILAVRPDLGLVLLWSSLGFTLLTVVFRPIRGKHWKSRITAISLLIALAVSFPSALAAVDAEPSVSKIEASTIDLGRESVSSSFSSGAGPQTVGAGPQTVGPVADLVLQSLSRLVNVLIGPFPSEIQGNTTMASLSLSTLHFLAICVIVAVAPLGFTSYREIRLAFIFTGICSVSLALFAVLFTNYGIVMRFRQISEILLLPVVFSTLRNFLHPAGLPSGFSTKANFAWLRRRE